MVTVSMILYHSSRIQYKTSCLKKDPRRGGSNTDVELLDTNMSSGHAKMAHEVRVAFGITNTSLLSSYKLGLD